MTPYSTNTFHLEDKFKLHLKVHLERLAIINNKAVSFKSVSLCGSNAKQIGSCQNRIAQVTTGVNRMSGKKNIDTGSLVGLRKRKIKNYATLAGYSSVPNHSEEIKQQNRLRVNNVQSSKNNGSKSVQTALRNQINKKHNNVLQVRFVDSTNFAKNLRKRTIKDYAELAGCSPDESVQQESVKHIPIYLKQNVIKSNKQHKDPFEFLAETPRRNKHSESDRDSILYDKDTHNILKRLEAKEEAQLRAKRNADKKLRRNAAISDVKKVVQSKPLVLNKNHTDVKKVADILNTSGDDIEGCFGFDNDSEEEEIHIVPASTTTQKPAPNLLAINKDTAFAALTSTPVLKGRHPSHNTNKVNIISDILIPAAPQFLQARNVHNTSIIRQSQRRITFSNQSTSQNNSVRLTPFSTMRQTAITSTPQNQIDFRDSTRIDSPWRSDDANVSRNPHFLALKNTWLPSYNQDMILDSKVLKEQPKAPVHSEKSLIQTSMLDFVDESVRSPSSKTIEQTLFDNAEFSPIKSNQAKVKRNVFGILNPNNQNVNEPQVYDVNNYFGFDSFNDVNDVNKENIINTYKSKKTRNEAQPTRVLHKEIKNLQQNIITDSPEIVESVVDTTEQEFPEEQKDDAPQVALFEDLIVLQHPRRSYERKRARRVRIKSVDSDESEEIIKPKTKRKDVRTPQEEEAFNKWVTQFNAMCKEVEHHTLEMD